MPLALRLLDAVHVTSHGARCVSTVLTDTVSLAAWDDAARASPLQQELMLLLGRTLRELGMQYSLPAIKRRTAQDVIEKAVAKQ